MWEQGSGTGRGSFVRGGARPGKLLRSRMSSIQPAQITSIDRYPVKGFSSQPPPSVALARNSLSSTIASPSWPPISTKPAAIAILSCAGGRLSASAPTRLVGPATAALCELILEQRRHPEQGFRACLRVVRLARYASVKSILDNHLTGDPRKSAPRTERRSCTQISVVRATTIRRTDLAQTSNLRPALRPRPAWHGQGSR